MTATIAMIAAAAVLPAVLFGRWAILRRDAASAADATATAIAAVLKLPRAAVRVWTTVPFLTPYRMTQGVLVDGKPHGEAERILWSLHAAARRLAAS